MGQNTLRITVQENEQAVEIKLEGRIAGPWVTELSRVWMETAPRLAQRELLLDLRNTTYADAAGKQALSYIHAQSGAALITSTPWTQYLAGEIRSLESQGNNCLEATPLMLSSTESDDHQVN